MTLDEVYRVLAMRLFAMGCPCDDTPGGPVAVYIRRKVRYRPDTLFFIVFGVNCELASMQAQAKGFADNIDRALKLARKG